MESCDFEIVRVAATNFFCNGRELYFPHENRFPGPQMSLFTLIHKRKCTQTKKIRFFNPKRYTEPHHVSFI